MGPPLLRARPRHAARQIERVLHTEKPAVFPIERIAADLPRPRRNPLQELRVANDLRRIPREPHHFKTVPGRDHAPHRSSEIELPVRPAHSQPAPQLRMTELRNFNERIRDPPLTVSVLVAAGR